MKPYLLKCSLFLCIQIAIFVTLESAFRSQPERPPAMSAGCYSLAQRAESFLHDNLYPVWTGNRQALAKLASASEDQGLLKQLATQFRRGPDNYLAAIIDKDAQLKSTEGNRIILVGGSGCAFGFDSQVLRDRYDYSPVNLGLHAGFGITFMLNHASEHVQAGDVVILCFEPSCFLHDADSLPPIVAKTIKDLASNYERYYAETPFDSAKTLTDNEAQQPKIDLVSLKRFADKEALPAAATRTRLYRDNLLAFFEDKDAEAERRDAFDDDFNHYRDQLVTAFLKAETVPIYRRTNFNDFGDFIGHRLAPERVATDLPLSTTPLPAALSTEESQNITHGLAQINAFASACEKRGAKVFFSHPPLMKSPSTASFANQFAAIVEKNLNVPVLFPIEETLFDEILYWDTDDHLNWRGTCWRMEKLMLALDKHLPPKTNQSVTTQIATRNAANWGRPQLATTNPNSWR